MINHIHHTKESNLIIIAEFHQLTTLNLKTGHGVDEFTSMPITAPKVEVATQFAIGRRHYRAVRTEGQPGHSEDAKTARSMDERKTNRCASGLTSELFHGFNELIAVPVLALSVWLTRSGEGHIIAPSPIRLL